MTYSVSTEKKSGLNVCTHHTPEGTHLGEMPWCAHKKLSFSNLCHIAVGTVLLGLSSSSTIQPRSFANDFHFFGLLRKHFQGKDY
jgi:hypothetical protein